MLTSPLLPPIGYISRSLYSLLSTGRNTVKGTLLWACYCEGGASVWLGTMLCYAMGTRKVGLARWKAGIMCKWTHLSCVWSYYMYDQGHEFEKQSRYLVSYHSVHRRPRALTEEISRGVNWWLLGSTLIFFSSKFCTNFLNWDLILNQLVHPLISIPLLNNTIQPLLFFQIIQLL